MKMRRSKQREAILRVVRHTTCHPTAEWVYAQVKQEIPGISLGTVYRNLRLLSETGDVLVLESGEGGSRFDGCTDTHYHFRCDRCGAVLDVDVPVDCELDRLVAARTGLTIRGHVLEFRGLCGECARVADAAPETEGQSTAGFRG